MLEKRRLQEENPGSVEDSNGHNKSHAQTNGTTTPTKVGSSSFTRRSTAHTHVLGLDGREDQAVGLTRKGKKQQQQQQAQWRPPTPPRTREKSWNPLAYFARRKDADSSSDLEDSKAYSSFDHSLILDVEEGGQQHGRNAALSTEENGEHNNAIVKSDTRKSSLENGLLDDSESDNVSDGVLTSPSFSTRQAIKDASVPRRCREEKLAQDCSFFYREMDDSQQQQERRKLPNNRRRPRLMLTTDYALQEDSEMMMGLPPRSRSDYRTRYKQLNADYGENMLFRSRDNAEYQEEVLFAQEPDDDCETSLADFSKSSLCYHLDGRVHMKLPNDKVRLLMDPFLESGIISVENSSYVPKVKDLRSQTDDGGEDEATRNNKELKTRPGKNEYHCPWKQELTYVLTVDDGLYRRLVKEIADSSAPCGLYYCFRDHGGGRVDIQVALGILAVLLCYLLITTLIWPVD